MATPKVDKHRAARLLAEAAFSTDAKTCENAGITVRTLQNYRAALATDVELSRLYDEARKLLTMRSWADETDLSLSVGVQKLRSLIESVQKPTPGNIAVVTEAVSKLGELAMTNRMLSARLKALEEEDAGYRPPQDAPSEHLPN